MEAPWHLYIMASMYIIAGIMHFAKPRIYLRIMPRYLPWPKLMVALSGLVEILLGIGLCIYFTRVYSIYLVIAMLTVFLLVHFYMLSSEKAGAGIPRWILVLRIPLQFVLIYWAYSYL